MPRFIYITGADGTGKTTQASLLAQHLRQRGLDVKRLWLRFPLFFSLPFLAFARIRGYSRYEVANGVRYGYWDFSTSFVMRNVFPWVYLLDASLAALIFVRLRMLLGKTIVCERFVLDMLADLMVGLGDYDLPQQSIGALLKKLIPQCSVIFWLDLSSSEIRRRRPDLALDARLDARIKAYRCIAGSLSMSMTRINTNGPIQQIQNQLLGHVVANVL